MGNWSSCGNAEQECGIENVAKLFWKERVWFLWGKSVRIDAARDGVVDLNKMFFTRNGLEFLVIQTVVHLRSAAN